MKNERLEELKRIVGNYIKNNFDEVAEEMSKTPEIFKNQLRNFILKSIANDLDRPIEKYKIHYENTTRFSTEKLKNMGILPMNSSLKNYLYNEYSSHGFSMYGRGKGYYYLHYEYFYEEELLQEYTSLAYSYYKDYLNKKCNINMTDEEFDELHTEINEIDDIIEEIDMPFLMGLSDVLSEKDLKMTLQEVLDNYK